VVLDGGEDVLGVDEDGVVMGGDDDEGTDGGRVGSSLSGGLSIGGP
jgi:hypothetical protein